MTDQEHLSKLPKLAGADDYINWRRRVKAFLQTKDFELFGLNDRPEDASAAQLRRWVEANVRAKGTIILTLADGPLAQVSTIVDDDNKTAKDLWTELDKIYRMSNTQMVINIKRELETMTFEKDEEWEKHVESFHRLISKLAAYDQPVSTESKVSMLLRTLPTRFAPIAMVAESSDVPFEKVIASVKAEISRRKNHDKPPITTPVAASTLMNNDKDTTRPKIHKDTCFVCGRRGHFANQCWYRQQINDGTRGRGRGNRGRRFRGQFHRRSGFSHNQRGNNLFTRGHSHHNSRPSDQSNNNWGIQSDGAGSSTQEPGANLQSYTPNTSSQPPFQGGFTAQLHFRATVATVDKEKKASCLIDSGGTHHFYHSKSSFITYDTVTEQKVLSASGTSDVIGKGTVKLPFDNNVTVEAYHTPEFSTNILSVGLLTSRYNVLFTQNTPAADDKSACIISKRSNNAVVFTTKLKNGLYEVPIDGSATDESATEPKQTDEPFDSCYTCKHSNYSLINVNSALEWHRKLGHISAQRFHVATKKYSSIPNFDLKTINDITCTDCIVAKTKRAPIPPSNRKTIQPLELIHLDVLGPMKTKSVGGRSYALGIIDDFSAFSTVYFLADRSQVYDATRQFMNHSERLTGEKLQAIRLDGAGEHKREMVSKLQAIEGVRLEFSPAYASQSNGKAERLVQELSIRARVMMMNTNVPESLWAEAMHHGNYLRNRLPSSSIKNATPISIWKSHANIVDFSSLPTFGQPGFAFIYRSPSTANRKLLARAEHVLFVGMESDEKLCRVYKPKIDRVNVVRLADFRPCSPSLLPPITTLLDGLSRQSDLDNMENYDSPSDEAFLGAFQASLTTFIAKGNLKDPRLPKSFNDAIQSPDWCAAIDREFNALRNRNTWKLIRRTPDMNVLPFTWVFRIKPLDATGKTVLYKARCCVRGDYQLAYFDFDPFTTYAPVASHEGIRILLAYAAARRLIVEGGDVSNAYLFGDIDCPVYIEQPTNSTGLKERHGYVCQLLKSMYGIKQAGRIWGSLLLTTLQRWNFQQAVSDERVLFKQEESHFILLIIVVDDFAFLSNSPAFLAAFKDQLQSTFDVKYFGSLKTFIGWEITQHENGIGISQERYTRELLTKYDLSNCNTTLTPMPTTADLLPKTDNEKPLSTDEHRLYRIQIGELLYLAVCTRPDIAFAVCALARSLHAPASRHLTMIRRILRYLSGTKNYGIHYKSNDQLDVKAYSDSDWAGCTTTRKSTTGFIITVNNSPVSWKSLRQSSIALSSAEAEYIALSTTSKELTWIRRLLWEIQFKQPFSRLSLIPTIPIYCDNTAAISTAFQPGVNARTKHFEVRLHHIRDLLSQNVISIRHISSEDDIADILTKPVDRKTIIRLRDMIMSRILKFDK